MGDRLKRPKARASCAVFLMVGGRRSPVRERLLIVPMMMALGPLMAHVPPLSQPHSVGEPVPAPR